MNTLCSCFVRDIFNIDDDALSEGCESDRHTWEFASVVWIQKTPRFLFVDAYYPGKLAFIQPSFLPGFIQSNFQNKFRCKGNRRVTTLRIRCFRYIFSTINTTYNCFFQTIARFYICFRQISTVCQCFGKITEDNEITPIVSFPEPAWISILKFHVYTLGSLLFLYAKLFHHGVVQPLSDFLFPVFYDCKFITVV